MAYQDHIIKELQEKIDALRKRVEELEAENLRTQEKLRVLESWAKNAGFNRQ